MERAEFEQWKPKEVARLLALVETERRYYQEIVASLPVSLVIVGNGLTVLSANRQFRARTGRKNDELLGKPLLEVLPLPELQAMATLAIETNQPSPKQDLLWDGKTVSVSALPLRGWEEDSDSEALLVVEDRSATIPKSGVEDRLGAIVWEFDAVSEKLLTVTGGLDPDQWLNRADPSDSDRLSRFFRQVIEGEGDLHSIEYLGIVGDQPTPVRETIRVERDSERKALRLSGFTTPIGQRLELEKQRIAAARSASLQRVSAKLAHDLNNLLMIVSGYGEEMKSSLPAEHPLHRDMREILNAAGRLAGLSGQFQQYSRRPVLALTPLRLEKIVDAAQHLISEALGPGRTLRLDLPEVSIPVRADAAQLTEALHSLARLAAHSLGDGGELVLSSAYSQSHEDGLPQDGLVQLRFEISQGAFPALWLEPWLAADEASHEVEQSASAAYQILRQSGGDLQIEDRHIQVLLPAARLEELPVEAPVPPPATPAPLVPEAEPTLETILVVEDEGGIRALVRKILRRQGYQVLEASGGQEALATLAASTSRVDLLLTDVMMPGMNGVELSRQALASHPDLRVLFVSGYTDESVLEAGQFPAGTAFLQKPFTLGGLLGKVREVLDSGAARHAAS